jgi:hypothetical protein
VQVVYFLATEVVLFGKLGKNEVVEAAGFGKNQQKKLRRLARPQGSAEKTRFFAKKFRPPSAVDLTADAANPFFAKIFDRLRRST